jgi:hypothetical protein
LLAGLAIYDLQAGALNAKDIELDQNTVLICRNGAVSNWGTFAAFGGTFQAGTQSHFLGKLQVLSSTNSQWCPPTNATLDLSGPAGTFLRFRDSHDVSWPGAGVRIVNWQPWWSGGGSSHHVFFGTNSQGLIQEQLNKLIFINPAGWPRGNYPARILSTGEVVPAVPPSLVVSRTSGGLILSWPGDYQLLTATNVLGPYAAIAGAASPFTNGFADRQRYFRLSLPAQ